MNTIEMDELTMSKSMKELEKIITLWCNKADVTEPLYIDFNHDTKRLLICTTMPNELIGANCEMYKYGLRMLANSDTIFKNYKIDIKVIDGIFTNCIKYNEILQTKSKVPVIVKPAYKK